MSSKRIKRKTVRLSPESQEILEMQLAAFRQRFGRDPIGEEPVFFDQESDSAEPQPMDDHKVMASAMNAMREAGIDEALIYAYAKTDGVLLTESNWHRWSPADRKAFQDAANEYEANAKINAAIEAAKNGSNV